MAIVNDRPASTAAAPVPRRKTFTESQSVLVVAVVALSVLSRLPQLLSPNLLLDGDECWVGIAAKHVAQLKEFPIFFYGQHYGFVPLETVAGAIAFTLFGTGAVALKAAMLSVWTAGVAFLFLALSKIVGGRRAFWIAAVLLVTPALAVFSMKARGGYVTAFAATGALLWLLVQEHAHDRLTRWLIAGVLSAVIYLAQPVWVPGVLPIAIVVLASRRRLLWALAYVAAAIAVIGLVKLAPATRSVTWGGPPVFGNRDLLGSIPMVGRQIYVSFTGSYYLWWPVDPPGPATRALAILWSVMLVAAPLMQGYRALTRRWCAASHLLFAGVASTIVAEWLLLGARDARYMLPLTGLLVSLAGIDAFDLLDRGLVPRRVITRAAAVLMLLGAWSMGEFAGYNFLWKNPGARWSEARRLQQLTSYLQVRGATHVYAMNGLLDSQVIFYSDEKVIAKSGNEVGRYPAYAREVTRALDAGELIGVVGYTDESGAPGCDAVPVCTGGIDRIVPDPEHIFRVDGKYFAYVGATREQLEKLRF